MSARHIYNGILNGSIRGESLATYRYLANDLGAPGKEYFERLVRIDKKHKRFAIIKARTDRVIKGYSDLGLKKIELKPENFVVYGASNTLPSSLFKYLKEQTPANRTAVCKTGPKCVLYAIDLDKDRKPEYVYIGKSTYGFDAFKQVGRDWEKLGEFQYSETYISFEDLVKNLQEKKVELVPSDVSNLKIGEIEYRFQK
jgi:hypothetical protein